MFKIGEFSQLSQVPVKTLRYYDETGLLKTAKVDRFTSYRYYSADQLPRLNRIARLELLPSGNLCIVWNARTPIVDTDSVLGDY
jgi:hypothetical protein